MTTSPKIALLSSSPSSSSTHLPPHATSVWPLADTAGLGEATGSPPLSKQLTEPVVVCDGLVLHVPIQYMKSPPNRLCRIDASLEETKYMMSEVNARHPSVVDMGGDAFDVGCRLSFDVNGYSFWAARAKTALDDPNWSMCVEGRLFWESTGDELAAFLGPLDAKVNDNSLYERLDAGQAFVETFQLMESLLPAPFKTLDDYMLEKQVAGRPGDQDGRAFSRYLAEGQTIVEQPEYPPASRASFYRFLLAWGAARRTLGAHFRVVPCLEKADDGNSLIEFEPDVSVAF